MGNDMSIQQISWVYIYMYIDVYVFLTGNMGKADLNAMYRMVITVTTRFCRTADGEISEYSSNKIGNRQTMRRQVMN